MLEYIEMKVWKQGVFTIHTYIYVSHRCYHLYFVFHNFTSSKSDALFGESLALQWQCSGEI